eukprot:GAHX01002731.1.p1 GENE.GAHX01002731.1~~GAHX01002731.1.p1  ORF type:complete len:646 (-),score=118.73 GAHX01002731.1:712-2628(-)
MTHFSNHDASNHKNDNSNSLIEQIPGKGAKIKSLLGLTLFKDNTKYACRLLSTPNSVMFIRPRKFGKSTFLKIIRTIAEGEGNKYLFRNTWVHSHSVNNDNNHSKDDKIANNKTHDTPIGQVPNIECYIWKTRPVIHINFSELQKPTDTLDNFLLSLLNHLKQIANSYSIYIEEITGGLESKINEYFKVLVHTLSTENPPLATKQSFLQKCVSRVSALHSNLFSWRAKDESKTGIVFLLDEYDYPVLKCEISSGETKDLKQLKLKCQSWLQSFLETHKALAEMTTSIYTSVVTGVTNITICDIASGANHLDDITLDRGFATVLGFTEEELKINFNNNKVEQLWQSALRRDGGILDLHDQENARTLIDNIPDNRNLEHLNFPDKKKLVLKGLKYKYNGYKFADNVKTVCNPYSITQCFKNGEFKYYLGLHNRHHIVFETIKKYAHIIIKLQSDDFKFDHILESDLIYSFDANDNNTEKNESLERKISRIVSTLFQFGYLTIKETPLKLINKRSGRIASYNEVTAYKNGQDRSNYEFQIVYNFDFANDENHSLLTNHLIHGNIMESTTMFPETFYGMKKIIEEGDWISFIQTIHLIIAKDHFEMIRQIGNNEKCFENYLLVQLKKDGLNVETQNEGNKGL